MNKNKKIILSIVIIIVIFTIITFTYLFFMKNNKNIKEPNKDNQDDKIQENIKYTYDENGPGFVCSNEPLGSKPFSYMVGEYVFCTISFEINGKRPGIEEIWAEYSLDEDVEYIETIDPSPTEWNLKEDNNKIHLVTSAPTAYDEYFYQVKFRIKPTTKKDKVTITFKDIKYKDEEGNYYKTDDSSHELFIGEKTNYYYKKSKNNNELIFYKLNQKNGYEEINRYICEGDFCGEYATQCAGYLDLNNGKMLIMDEDKTILYDFNNGPIGTYSTYIEDLENYFVVQNPETEKFGIIDKNGKIIKELTSDGFGIKVNKCFNHNTYSLKYDLIIEKKDNKYGVIKITKDEVIVSHQFDNIRLYNDKYFKAKEDNFWYLYNINTKEKAIEEGYKELFIVTDEIIIVQIDNYLYIKNYQGNNIIEDKIEVFIPYNEGACCGSPGGVSIREDDGIISIFIDEETSEEDIGYKTYKYEYNIKEQKLTKENK